MGAQSRQGSFLHALGPGRAFFDESQCYFSDIKDK